MSSDDHDALHRSDASTFEVRPVGWVQSSLTNVRDAPRQGSEGAPAASLVFRPDLAAALEGIEPNTELLLLIWFDRARRDVVRTRPRDDPRRAEVGVFVTRSPDRPNPIGLHRVTVLAVDGVRLAVEPLEALDGSPIVDVKPVLDDRDR